MAHLHFDPLQSQPFLSAVLKFMYLHLVISTSLAEEMEGGASNFDKVLTDDFVRDHLQPQWPLPLLQKEDWGRGGPSSFRLASTTEMYASPLSAWWMVVGVLYQARLQ